MDETISVRIPVEDLKRLEKISQQAHLTKSAMLRDVLEIGIRQKMLQLALEKFQKEEVTAEKAAQLADIPLTRFLDILKENNIEFHYSMQDLVEEFEGI